MTVAVTDSNIYSKLLHSNDDKRHCIVQVWEWAPAQAECGERHHRAAPCPWRPDSDKSWPGVPDWEHHWGARLPQEEPRGGESSWPLPASSLGSISIHPGSSITMCGPKGSKAEHSSIPGIKGVNVFSKKNLQFRNYCLKKYTNGSHDFCPHSTGQALRK